MSFFDAGDAITSLDDSQPAARIGLPPGVQENVCYVGEGRIAFYLQHGAYGYEGCADLEIFSHYFRKDHAAFGRPSNSAYAATGHFDKRFPDEFP